MCTVVPAARYFINRLESKKDLSARPNAPLSYDDRDAAELSGINTSRVLFSVYAVAGLIIGIAGWITIGRVGSASPNVAPDINLDTITAVVIGGTSLFGGRGTMIGTLLGALIVTVVQNGLALAGLDQAYRVLAIGILVIAAVALDQWIRKVKA